MIQPAPAPADSAPRLPNPFARLKLQDLAQSPAANAPTAPVIGEQYCEIRLEAVTSASTLQTRAPFNPEQDAEDSALLDSLHEDGQRVPVLLTATEGALGTFTVLDGHRRIAALRRLGRETAKAIILQSGTLNCDLITLTAQVRKNLTPLEQAGAISRLRERHHFTLEVIARRVGLTRQYIHQLNELLATDPAVQAEVAGGRLSAKAARVLGQAPRAEQPDLARVAGEGSLSERDARRLVERVAKSGQPPAQAARELGLAPTAAPNLDLAVRNVLAEVDSVPAGQSPVAPPQLIRGRRRRMLGEAAEVTALVTGFFPELEARDVQALAAVVANRTLNPQIVKAAGLLIMSGWGATDAVEAAEMLPRDRGVHRLVAMLEACVDFQAVLSGGPCLPEYAPMLASLGKKLSSLKQGALQAEARTDKRR